MMSGRLAVKQSKLPIIPRYLASLMGSPSSSRVSLVSDDIGVLIDQGRNSIHPSCSISVELMMRNDCFGEFIAKLSDPKLSKRRSDDVKVNKDLRTDE
ncbi:hypothetical protein Tco_0085585 [Tanacetum coccineum]